MTIVTRGEPRWAWVYAVAEAYRCAHVVCVVSGRVVRNEERDGAVGGHDTLLDLHMLHERRSSFTVPCLRTFSVRKVGARRSSLSEDVSLPVSIPRSPTFEFCKPC